MKFDLYQVHVSARFDLDLGWVLGEGDLASCLGKVVNQCDAYQISCESSRKEDLQKIFDQVVCSRVSYECPRSLLNEMRDMSTQ